MSTVKERLKNFRLRSKIFTKQESMMEVDYTDETLRTIGKATKMNSCMVRSKENSKILKRKINFHVQQFIGVQSVSETVMFQRSWITFNLVTILECFLSMRILHKF